MTTKTVTRSRARKTPAVIEPEGMSKRSIGLISASAILASIGAGLYAAKRANLLPFTPKPPSAARSVLNVLTKPSVLIGLGAAAGLGLFRWQMSRLFSEQASYDVETCVGPDEVEIRHYAPQVVAETTVRTDTFREALDIGFATLAEYIFGHNATGEKIEMTAPVTQSREGRRSDIAMNEDGTWLVRFVMPGSSSLASLPSPLNHQVRLRAVPARRVAALRYSGTFNSEESEQMQLRLLANLKTQGLKPAGETTFAGYDAPWVLPFLRRNEALVDLAT